MPIVEDLWLFVLELVLTHLNRFNSPWGPPLRYSWFSDKFLATMKPSIRALVFLAGDNFFFFTFPLHQLQGEEGVMNDFRINCWLIALAAFVSCLFSPTWWDILPCEKIHCSIAWRRLHESWGSSMSCKNSQPLEFCYQWVKRAPHFLHLSNGCSKEIF